MARRDAWTAEENAATVAAYLDMLAQELAGQPYVKSHQRQKLMEMFGRSRGAYELKFANISAILRDMHCLYIKGYKPRGNFQHSLADEIRKQLYAESNKVLLNLMQTSVSAQATERMDIAWTTSKMPDRVLVEYGGMAHRQGGVHTDYVALEAANTSLGVAGELAVLERERTRLREGGRADLADQVEHVSQTKGDGLGYDIKSYDLHEHERHIEVKTTRRDINWPMIVSRNEVRVSREQPQNYVLARVYQFAAKKIGLYELPGDINVTCDLEPITFEALPKQSVLA